MRTLRVRHLRMDRHVRMLDSLNGPRKTPSAAFAANDLVDQFASAVAERGPASVRVLGEQPALCAALIARGLHVVPTGGAACAIVSATATLAEWDAEDLGSSTPEILLWHADGAHLGEWITMLALHGYFRSAEQPISVPGITCVRLEASSPAPSELVRRYEAVIAAAPDSSDDWTQLRHDLLTSRDHAIGSEAEIARLRIKQREAEEEIAAIRASNTWQVGTMLTSVPARLKRLLRP
jgi:hypothetical protein